MFHTILSAVLALEFLAFGAARIRMIPQMFEQARRLGIHYPQFRVAGAIEVILAAMVLAGIWVGWLSTLGALLMTVAAAIAIVAHARANSMLARYVPAMVTCVLAFILFLMRIYS
jgi:hypothetical protein